MASRGFRNGVISTIVLLLMLAFSFSPAGAQSDANSFKGQTITIIVGSFERGGTDSLARLLARNLYKFIPGKPRMVVSNRSGAAGLIAANYLDSRAKKDGTVIGTLATGLTFRKKNAWIT